MIEATAKLSLFTTVALLRDMVGAGLARGQVGTVVEILEEDTALVEFSDEGGHAYSLVPCAWTELLALKTSPLSA
jgi:hypothetical protein